MKFNPLHLRPKPAQNPLTVPSLPTELWLQILSHHPSPAHLWLRVRPVSRQLQSCVETVFASRYLPLTRIIYPLWKEGVPDICLSFSHFRHGGRRAMFIDRKARGGVDVEYDEETRASMARLWDWRLSLDAAADYGVCIPQQVVLGARVFDTALPGFKADAGSWSVEVEWRGMVAAFFAEWERADRYALQWAREHGAKSWWLGGGKGGLLKRLEREECPARAVELVPVRDREEFGVWVRRAARRERLSRVSRRQGKGDYPRNAMERHMEELMLYSLMQSEEEVRKGWK